MRGRFSLIRVMAMLTICLTAIMTMSAVPAVAATQLINSEGIYIMGDNDSPKIARDAARTEAMRSAVEQAGVYVESYTRTNNMVLTADEVRIISGAVLKVVSEEYTPELIDGVWRYRVRLVCEADMDMVKLQELMRNKHELERLQRERDELKAQNEVLLSRYENATGVERTTIERELEASYSVSKVFDDVVAMLQRGENERAVQEVSKLIEAKNIMDSPLAYAYFLRGRAYYELRSDKLALEDFARAERIPHDNEAYPIWRLHQYRGLIYYDDKNYDEAADELAIAWDLSDKTDEELWLSLRRAENKAEKAERRRKERAEWGRIIGDIVIGSIRVGY